MTGARDNRSYWRGWFQIDTKGDHREAQRLADKHLAAANLQDRSDAGAKGALKGRKEIPSA